MVVIGDPVLEVYKMYTNYKGETDLILGEIDSETYEYYLGFRFYGSMGGMYKEDGSFFTEDPTLKLRRPANDVEISAFKGTGARVSLEHISSHPAYIAVREIPDFQMGPGKIYIDRMGFHVREMYYSLYHLNGHAVGMSMPSMRDIMWETDQDKLSRLSPDWSPKIT